MMREMGAESRYSTLPSRCALHAVNLVLFQRDNCHLCDLALEVLAQARAPEFASVFIDDDAQLETRYGERVPVLRDERRGTELDWPFDADKLHDFLGG